MSRRETSRDIHFVKYNTKALRPRRGSAQAAGLDLFSATYVNIGPGETKVVDTGIGFKMPRDCYGRISSRSDLSAEKCIDIFAGVIDPDFTGSVKVVLHNAGKNTLEVVPGSAVGQIIFEKFVAPSRLFEEPSLPCTIRGNAGLSKFTAADTCDSIASHMVTGITVENQEMGNVATAPLYVSNFSGTLGDALVGEDLLMNCALERCESLVE